MDRFEFNWRSPDGLQMYGQGWQPERAMQAVVCLVHGLGEHSGRYARVAADLTRAGFGLVSFDLRGHGRSEGMRGHTPSLEALLDDIDQLLVLAAERYPGLPRFLYGHSLGGGLVLCYALRRQPDVAGVVASAPMLRLAFSPPAPKVFMARMMDRFYPHWQQASAIDTQALSHDPQVVRDYIADPLVHDRITARLYASMVNAGEWSLGRAAEFPLPLLLIQGGADRLVSVPASHEFAVAMPGHCIYREWEGLYHEVHNEPNREEVIAYVIEWLKRHMPAPAIEPAGVRGGTVG